MLSEHIRIDLVLLWWQIFDRTVHYNDDSRALLLVPVAVMTLATTLRRLRVLSAAPSGAQVRLQAAGLTGCICRRPRIG